MASMMTTSTMVILPSTTTTCRLSLAPTKGRVTAKKNQPSEVCASLSVKEHAVATAAMTAMLVIPEIAEAAVQPGMSPSLNNFLLSIASGGLVLTAIIGAVVGVSNFDPVKRA